MSMSKSRVLLAFTAATALFVYGCGGNVTTPSAQITGTAATGSALANASVAITDSSGNSPCVETSITTNSVGSYTCTLKSGETAPFFVVVTDPSGLIPPLVSIATTTPAAGTPLTVNATPLTTAIVAQLNNGNALGVVSNPALYVPANLAAITTNVLAQLQSVLTAISAPANYNPFTTNITAAAASQAGNTADLVLDVVKVVTDSNGNLALSTISDPTPVTMAGTTPATTNLTAPTGGVATLPQALQAAAQSLTSCFAAPTAQRAPTDTSPPPHFRSGRTRGCFNFVKLQQFPERRCGGANGGNHPELQT